MYLCVSAAQARSVHAETAEGEGDSGRRGLPVPARHPGVSAAVSGRLRRTGEAGRGLRGEHFREDGASETDILGRTGPPRRTF